MHNIHLDTILRKPHWLSAGVLALTITLAACSNLPSETYMLEDISVGEEPYPWDPVNETLRVRGVVADAKSRFVWTPTRPVLVLSGVDATDGLESRKVEERRVICAEPSPDALVTFSTALSAAVRGELAGQGAVSGELRRSLSETGRVLGERTPTIQLLRDNLYRACEAYANGVLDSFAYALVLTRIDELMVNLVAIEALGRGTLKPDDEKLVQAAVSAEETLQATNSKRADASRRLSEADQQVKSLNEQKTSLSIDIARVQRQKTIADAEVTAGGEAASTLSAKRTESARLAGEIGKSEATIATQENIVNGAGTDEQKAAAREKIATEEASLAGLHDQKVETDQEIARLTQIRNGTSSANTRASAAAAELADLKAREETVDRQRTEAIARRATAATDLTTQETAVTTAMGDLEAARRNAGSVRPELGQNERNQIERIVEREQTVNNPATLAAACMVWYASHPRQPKDGIIGASTSSANGTSGARPAIAEYCSLILKNAGEFQKPELENKQLQLQIELKKLEQRDPSPNNARILPDEGDLAFDDTPFHLSSDVEFGSE